MKKTLLTLTLLLTGLFSAKASSFAPTNGDLFLGFEASAGTGASTNYVVDLGAAANLASVNLHIATDLSSIYGTNWYSRTDLYYGIIAGVSPAANGDPNNTLYASVTSGGAAWQSATTQHPTVQQVNGLLAQMSTDINNNQLGSASNSVLMATSEGGSWSFYSTYGSTSFGAFPGSIETGMGTSLDIYRLVPANGTDGTLFETISLSSTGLISAVPEPGTYALFGLGTLVLLIAARRRQIASVERKLA